jgi:nitrogen regulatory protein PII
MEAWVTIQMAKSRRHLYAGRHKRALGASAREIFLHMAKDAAAPAANTDRTMKMVMAYVLEEAFEPIRSELLERGFPCVTMCAAVGSGRQEGPPLRVHRDAGSGGSGEDQGPAHLRSNVKIECAVADGDAPTIVDTILRHARTGSIGDGKVFVLPVEQAYRIRTGEAGEDTLQAHPRVLAAL